ncbi:Phox-like protein, partial [Nadsonia fulvescens var. elongata DSM 6958]
MYEKNRLSNTSMASVSTHSDKSPSSRPGSTLNTQTNGTGSKLQNSLYGVVLYDFVAERPDELDAKEGDAIIVIAQSNHEWIVAKPIGKLGGPGLIPISYIQIRNTVSGQDIDDVEEAIRKAGVPKVEEWKRMTAEYKASSIPLGRFDEESSQANIPNSFQNQFKNMTLQQEQRQSGQYQQQQQFQPQGDDNIQEYGPEEEDDDQGDHSLVVSASVENYAKQNGRYWYLVICELENGHYRSLCRFYQDFYDFQIVLLKEFPEEAGHTGQTRLLPFMPGPLAHVNDSISSQRIVNLDDYVRKLLSLPDYISKSPIAQSLFTLRQGDVKSTTRESISLPSPPDANNAETKHIHHHQQQQQQQINSQNFYNI